MMNISTMSDSASSDKNDPKACNDEHDSYQEEGKMEEIFPWQVKFNELCRAAVGSKSMKMLENLLTVYLQKGSKTVHDCYMKPNRAGKLKKCMSDALVFFHLFYQDIKESFENSTYLEKMTELMAMYLDIEIKASRRRKEHVKKVVCRLTSALNIFLDHSENHILDVIIRAKFINKNYREICSPVLGSLSYITVYARDQINIKSRASELYPVSFTLDNRGLTVVYFSDGAASQYKNKKNFINLCHHEVDFNVKAEWHFFATSHGKGPCDGVGGTVKRLAARASLQRPYNEQIMTPQDLFLFGKENVKSVDRVGKLLTSLRVYPMNDTLYVRYLLVFKLWKKVVADADERKNINKIAIQNLPAPSNFMERYKRFNNVLPRVPNSMNVTTFYMQAKFNLKTACQAFMKISKDPQQPIISDKPLFFEGRLASSQSTFSGKANAFECGVSRNLMNDIWSIAEPATSQKKSTPGEKDDEATRKKAKDKPNKNGGKKKTKDWFDKEKKKNGKNKTILFGNFRGNNSPTNLPQGDLEVVSISTKEPIAVAVAMALAAKPSAIPAVETLAAAAEEAVPCPAPEIPPPETKPSPDTLTPRPRPETPPAKEDTKPLALKTQEVDLSSPVHRVDIPKIRLTPPTEDVTKKETPSPGPYAISCRKFEDSRVLGGNLFSGQIREESVGSTDVEDCVGMKVVEVMESVEVVKARDLSELMEVRSSAKEVVPAPCIADPEYLDHEQDVVNEVTIATSELDISVRDNDVELPVYLQCHKEVVIETVDQPSPVELCRPEDEVPSVIVPRFKPSHSPEAGQLVVEPLPVRDNFKFAIPSPPRVAQEQPVYEELREEVKPEMGPPPDDLSFSKEAPPIDEELVPDWNQLPFGFFQTGNNSDLFLDCIDMRGFELDPAIDPCVINPRMLEQPGPSAIKRRASEEYPQYPRMFLDPALHRTRVESVMPPQEFLADDYLSFASTSDHFPYYNARDLYGNYNPNAFFEEPVSQTPSRGGSNHKQVPTSSVESENPPCNTVDYSSSSLNSSNNSILSACDKDNVARHSRGARVPSNSDNNYYRETDTRKAQDELRKTEPIASSIVSILKHPNLSNASVGVDKQSPKTVGSNPHRKTPHPVLVQQDNRSTVGYNPNSTAVDCKVQLSQLGPEEGSPTPKPTFRGGMFLGGTGRPMHYLSVEVPIPIAIPYSAASRHGIKCTCEDCFNDVQDYLFQMPASAPNTLVQGFHPSGLKTRADELKHQDDQILKKIEESMKEAPVKETPQVVDSESFVADGRCKTEPVSTLPPKKRHKLSSDLSESAPPEGFPNFGVRPMMSILSLQPGVSNNPLPLQENNSNVKDDYTSTKPNANISNVETKQLQQQNQLHQPIQLQQPNQLHKPNQLHQPIQLQQPTQLQQQTNNVNVVKPAHTTPTSTARYSSQEMDDTEINSRKRDEVIANYWEKKGIPQKKPVSDDTKNNSVPEKETVVANNRQYKPSQPSRTYPAPTKTHVNVNYAEPAENVRRQFKTPAQLKELPLNRDLHYCFPYNCPLHAYGNWNQTAAESMILHRESYVPQPPPVYRMTEPAKPPSTEHKSERKKSSSSQKKSSSSSTSTKRTRCSNRKSQSGSGTGDSSEPKRKRKDNSRYYYKKKYSCKSYRTR